MELPYHYALAMARAKHLAASVLLAAGIVLVFAGLSSALGFTVSGMVASVAVIAGLLYAGGIWFGGPAPAAPTGARLFDQRLEQTTGGPVLLQFPEPLRAEIRARCLAALAGERARFTIDDRAFQVLPVVDVDGMVRFGVLIEGAPAAHVGIA
jgi:hypothetical protein